jgi:DegV family protein with EDD domain
VGSSENARGGGRVRVVTDSLAWLPQAAVDAHGIRVVPLHVSFGDQQFTETVDLTNEEFYQRLRAGGKPTTSQPSPGEFLDAYTELARDADAVISIHASAKLSGTFQSATIAAATARGSFPGVRFEVFDTQLVAPAQGMVVIHVARSLAAGMSVDDAMAEAARIAPRLHAMIVPDTIEYLVRGGRASRFQGFVGGLLNLRPILHLDGGLVVPRDRVRTRARSIERLVALVAEDAPSGRLGHVGLMHAEAPDARDELRRQMAARFEVAEWLEVEIGPVLGTHAGPGAIGVTWHEAD